MLSPDIPHLPVYHWLVLNGDTPPPNDVWTLRFWVLVARTTISQSNPSFPSKMGAVGSWMPLLLYPFCSLLFLTGMKASEQSA